MAFPATLFLRHTSHHFLPLIPPLTTLPALLAAESTPGAQALNIYTCAVCLRLRRARHFSGRYRNEQWCRHGNERHTRFCIDCGVKGTDQELRCGE